jgi:DNA-binding NarL/FixJ family response regulator
MKQPDKSPVQVLVVDDHALFVESLQARFEQDERFQVVGTAADGRSTGLRRRGACGRSSLRRM